MEDCSVINENLIRFTLQCNVARLTALLHRREDLDVGQVEEGRTLEVRAYVENKAAQASASWLSGGPFQGQSVPQAALSFGQPRPISRLGGAGRPYWPCFSHRCALAASSSTWAVHAYMWRMPPRGFGQIALQQAPPAPDRAQGGLHASTSLGQPRPIGRGMSLLAGPTGAALHMGGHILGQLVAAHAVLGRAALSCSRRGAADGLGRMRYRGAAAMRGRGRRCRRR